MRQHENIVVFCDGKTKYNPQMVLRDTPIKSGGTNHSIVAPIAHKDKNFKRTYTHKNPTTIIGYDKVRKGSLHPTQNPLPLLEYLVLTYTDESETVLDFTMGSGTTGVACKNLNRNFIGIELDETYFNIAKKRIEEAK
jgi:site-specific DNA-methyltransferase (adenine-specific)